MFQEQGTEGPRGTFESYLAEGDTLYKKGEFSKAVEGYTTALGLRRNDKNALVQRSRCHLRMGDSTNALKDVEASLSQDKLFHKGLLQKAEVLYSTAEFELSLVFYHRGYKLRPELEEFRLGIQKAQEAIDNCVGSPETVQLTMEGDLSYFEMQKNLNNGKKRKVMKPKPDSPVSRDMPMPMTSDRRKEKSVKQLLGELYGDKAYLEDLLKDTDQGTRTGQTIYKLVCDGLKYLNHRTDFWRQQKPLCVRKQERQLLYQHNTINNTIIIQLEKIDLMQSHEKYQQSINSSKLLLKKITAMPESAITNRPDVIGSIYSCIGDSYFAQDNFPDAIKYYKMDLEIGEKNNVNGIKCRAAGSLGKAYTKMGRYHTAIDMFSENLTMTDESIEQTWLFHEIGRCYLEINNATTAEKFGKASIQKAIEASDLVWHLNSQVLVAQSQVKQGKHKQALGTFDKALDLAIEIDDSGAISAIKTAVRMLQTEKPSTVPTIVT